MYRSVRAAALSIKPKKWDKPANADKLEDFVRQAAAQGAELVVAPEGFLEGYIVMDVIEDPDRRDDMWDVAEPPDGPYIQRFSGLARELSIVLCFGYAEQRDDGVYNAAIILGPDGEHCGTYYKTQLAEGSCDDWDFNRLGSNLQAIDTPLARVGTMICNDRWNPLIARAQVMDGAQAILIPSYGSRSREQNLAVIARARENGVPVVEANVGVNLIVSKGEVAAYVWGTDRISVATIEVPLPPSEDNARAVEEEFMAWRAPEMQRRYERKMKQVTG